LRYTISQLAPAIPVGQTQVPPLQGALFLQLTPKQASFLQEEEYNTAQKADNVMIALMAIKRIDFIYNFTLEYCKFGIKNRENKI
jgi:hypothetical protein